MQQATITPIHLQVSPAMPGHGTGIEGEAGNDEVYRQEDSNMTMLLSVIANFVGGTVLLSAMFALPHLLGFILS